MSNIEVHNVNVDSQDVLITPEQLKAELPMSTEVHDTVVDSRAVIQDILDRKDPRIFAVVGPCSIHDPVAAMDYARRLRALADDIGDTIYIIMRVYFEKPRTTVGWKGLVNDPYLDDSFKIEEGLHIGRKLLLNILELGLPTSTEALDPISPQYLQDLITWTAIGARTTESQTHRELASGLSSPVGFKNGTDGSLTVATNALKSAAKPHRFLGINRQGQVSVFTTRGNPYAHIVLRGGSAGPNYDSVHIKLAETALAEAGVRPNIMVDCSHANSNKEPQLQTLVAEDLSNQIVEGNTSIVGLMIESNLEAGNQSIPENLDDLQYGVSITDGCIDWDSTEACLREMHERLKEVLPARVAGAHQRSAGL